MAEYIVPGSIKCVRTLPDPADLRGPRDVKGPFTEPTRPVDVVCDMMVDKRVANVTQRQRDSGATDLVILMDDGVEVVLRAYVEGINIVVRYIVEKEMMFP